MRRSFRRLLTVGLALVPLAMVSPAAGQEPEERLRELERKVEQLESRLEAVQDTGAVSEIRRQIIVITREIEELRLGQDVLLQADTSILGFGPAASKVYKVRQSGVSIGGYGEMLYENFAGELENGTPVDRDDVADFLRAIVYIGYKFNDRLLFNSEIEVEHADEIFVEFAYLDYLFSDDIGARGGMLLIPMGFLNELHEPPIFLGTERPVTERVIIPSTWRENGFGLFGGFGDFNWRAYVVNGLEGRNFSAGGIRGGRQKGARAIANDLAVTGRVDYEGILGLSLGTSVYYGGSGQDIEGPAGDELDVGTFIWEGHADYAAHGLELRGLYALASLDEVASLNLALGLEGAASIGERLSGGYIQAGYDILRSVDTTHQLMPYVRFERVDTQAEVPDTFEESPATEQTFVVLGGEWQPIPNAVLKADYTIHSTEADTGLNQFNVALGYLF